MSVVAEPSEWVYNPNRKLAPCASCDWCSVHVLPERCEAAWAEAEAAGMPDEQMHQLCWMRGGWRWRSDPADTRCVECFDKPAHGRVG